LKKQSQSVPGINGVTSFVKGDYDNIPADGDEENKANQSRPEHVEWGQFHAPSLTEGAKQTSEV
jgi:hypothetical protein